MEFAVQCRGFRRSSYRGGCGGSALRSVRKDVASAPAPVRFLTSGKGSLTPLTSLVQGRLLGCRPTSPEQLSRV